MQCREASELVSLRLDVALPPTAEQSLQEHLGECQGCHWEADALARLDLLLSEAPRVRPAPQFAGRVMARIHRRRRWMAVWRGGVVLVLGMIIMAALCLVPLAHPASPVADVLNSPSLVSTLVGVLVRIANLAATLMGAARLVGEAFVGSSGHLFLAGLMALAAGLALIWLRLVGRASMAVGKTS
jgi:predicted anti-sigma-YlaC factor YlaD